jgi:PAS domain-containing protein
MRKTKPIQKTPRIAKRRNLATVASRELGDHAEELMELAVDAAQSRHLPGFLERFAERSARMLSAGWCSVMVFRGRETDSYQTSNSKARPDAAQHTSLIRQARALGKDIVVVPSEETSADAPGSNNQAAVFIPITASDAESLGAICLICENTNLGDGKQRLLRALASHAALSLENFRRFSQLERSKRQWVEDIDAISDYIVVHDRSWRVVRTNRSLASHLGVPPVALVGEAMSSLRQIAETGSDLPCPFAAIPSSRARNMLSLRRSEYFSFPRRVRRVSRMTIRALFMF